MSLITEALLVACGALPTGARLYAAPLAAACDARGIAGADLVPFLANVLNETAALTAVIEDTYYTSAEYIIEVFPSHFDRPNYAAACVRNSAALAAKVYGGWQGRGLAMLTGAANCRAYGVAAGLPLAQVAAYLVTPAGAADSAAWFFVRSGCLTMHADLLAVTRAWEGGARPIGWASVQKWAAQVEHAMPPPPHVAMRRPPPRRATAAKVPDPAPQAEADALMDEHDPHDAE